MAKSPGVLLAGISSDLFNDGGDDRVGHITIIITAIVAANIAELGIAMFDMSYAQRLDG